MQHLNEKTREFVLISTDEQRIIEARKVRWIGYTLANDILNEMNQLLSVEKYSRMPNILLVGDTNNGKTELIERFLKNHPAKMNSSFGIDCPVILIQAPPEPDEKRFYNLILDKLGAPYRTTENIDVRQKRVKTLMQQLNVKILIIDEIHHVLAGVPTKQRKFLNVLKFLANDLKISMICAGIADAYNVISSDPQLSNRFDPLVLKRWSYTNDYKRILLSFEKVLPLKEESNLIEESISRKILAMSEGLIGEIFKILKLSTIMAIESKIEKITPNILNNINYTVPSERNRLRFKN